ncbi:hypothetical protein E4U43_006246 [Claviceps pusilla]|uniref:DUF7924 domain-containing protein n=1 Tax=Claviceps pusilla TaxID=123648 RepID=A0A9P7NEU8_9HYPO|nr:hypothetical protein E4U43_006246 [Claviceps pusilla]
MASGQIRKRPRASDHSQETDLRRKKPRFETCVSPDNFSPLFWDTLPQIKLTRRALREVDRRHSLQAHTRTESAGIVSKNLARFSRRGGPDLSRLRGYPYPPSARHNMSFETPKTVDGPAKVKKSSAYDANFETHLVHHNIYPKDHEFSDGRATPEPSGMDSLQQDLSAARASLSPSRFSESAFREFKRKNRTTSEGTLMRNAIPIIMGDANIANEGNIHFKHLESMTGEDTVAPVPDFFDGAPAGAVDKDVMRELGSKIKPSKRAGVPVVPNFFLEAKAPEGSPLVADRQACFDGANGSRGIHALQNHGTPQPVYDGIPYTFSSTYQSGHLQLYAHHLTAPDAPGGTPGYHMMQIDAWAMNGNINSFRSGATALRNARDIARRHRDRFIENANTRARAVREAHGARRARVTRRAQERGRQEDIGDGSPSQASTVPEEGATSGSTSQTSFPSSPRKSTDSAVQTCPTGPPT